MRYCVLPIILILIIVGCIPVGKVTEALDINSPDVCMRGKLPQVKEIDIRDLAGQSITLQFNHIACGTQACNGNTRYIDDIEFLDADGNVIEPSQPVQLTPQQDFKQRSNAFTAQLAQQGIASTEYKIYFLSREIIIEFFDPIESTEAQIKDKMLTIVQAAAINFVESDFVTVHYFKNKVPNSKVTVAAIEVLGKNKQTLMEEVVFTPLQPDEVLAK